MTWWNTFCRNCNDVIICDHIYFIFNYFVCYIRFYGNFGKLFIMGCRTVAFLCPSFGSKSFKFDCTYNRPADFILSITFPSIELSAVRSISRSLFIFIYAGHTMCSDGLIWPFKLMEISLKSFKKSPMASMAPKSIFLTDLICCYFCTFVTVQFVCVAVFVCTLCNKNNWGQFYNYRWRSRFRENYSNKEHVIIFRYHLGAFSYECTLFR